MATIKLKRVLEVEGGDVNLVTTFDDYLIAKKAGIIVDAESTAPIAPGTLRIKFISVSFEDEVILVMSSKEYIAAKKAGIIGVVGSKVVARKTASVKVGEKATSFKSSASVAKSPVAKSSASVAKPSASVAKSPVAKSSASVAKAPVPKAPVSVAKAPIPASVGPAPVPASVVPVAKAPASVGPVAKAKKRSRVVARWGVGDRVEVFEVESGLNTKGSYYPGTVTAVDDDSLTYSVTFANKETVDDISEEDIRKCRPADMDREYVVGDSVDVLVPRLRNSWWQAKINKVMKKGLYDVTYIMPPEYGGVGYQCLDEVKQKHLRLTADY